jgi:hypothetical protein
VKLNRTEIGVIARRLAEELTEINRIKIAEAEKLADIKNLKTAQVLFKKFQTMPDLMKRVLAHHGRVSVNNLDVKDIQIALRPHFESAYVRSREIEDQLVIDQIACPDVNDLIAQVKARFLAKPILIEED